MAERRNFGFGTCPEPTCKKENVRLTAEGKIRSHGKRTDPCKGSGSKPLEDQDTGDVLAAVADHSAQDYADTEDRSETADWLLFRKWEMDDATSRLGEIPGHGTVTWAQEALALNGKKGGPDQDTYTRALLVCKAGSLDKLTPATRAALQWSRSPEHPADPTVGQVGQWPVPGSDQRPTATEYRAASELIDGGFRSNWTDGTDSTALDAAQDVIERATNHGVRPDDDNPGPNPWRKPLPTTQPGATPDVVTLTVPEGSPAALPGETAAEYRDRVQGAKARASVAHHAAAVARQQGVSTPTPFRELSSTDMVGAARKNNSPPDVVPNWGTPDQMAHAAALPAPREPAAPIASSPDPRFTAAPPAPSEHASHPDAPVHSLRPGPQDGIDFDQWGRYKIPDPLTREFQGRQRVTTFIKGLGDQYGLTKWQQRVLLAAAAHYPMSRQVTEARELAPAKPGGGFDVKTNAGALDTLADALKTAGGDKVAADIGTKVHRYTELYDLGRLALADVPDPFRADVESYVRKIQAAGLVSIPDMLERTTIVRSLGVAGTFDKIFRLPNGQYVIGDVKTGQTMEYAALDIRQQLACYAHGVNENGIWEWDNDVAERGRWLPAPQVRTDYAIVVHIPAGSGTCTLRRVDLVQGWADCALSARVRDARKTRKDLPLLITDGPEFDPAVPGMQEYDPRSMDTPAYLPPAAYQREDGHAPALPYPEVTQLPELPETTFQGNGTGQMLGVLGPSGGTLIPTPGDAFQVQPPSLPELAPAPEPDLTTLRGYARDAMWAAFQQNRGGQAAVYETAMATFPAGDPVLLELVTIGRGEPPF